MHWHAIVNILNLAKTKFFYADFLVLTNKMFLEITNTYMTAKSYKTIKNFHCIVACFNPFHPDCKEIYF